MFAEFVGGPMDGQKRWIREAIQYSIMFPMPQELPYLKCEGDPPSKVSPEVIQYVIHIQTRTFCVYVLADSELSKWPVNHDVVRYFHVAEQRLEHELADWAKSSADFRDAGSIAMFWLEYLAAARITRRMQRRKEASA